MDKIYTSNIEDKRLNIEESTTLGEPIIPRQIWRDAGFIPGSPYGVFDDLNTQAGSTGDYFYTDYICRDGIYQIPVMKKITNLALYKVAGTTNVFKDKYGLLADVIDRSFDSNPNPESSDYSYQFILYNKNKEELAYGLGDPVIDIQSGLLYIRNEDFINEYISSIKEGEIVFYIKFYKYIGRKGVFGSPSSNNTYNEDLTGVDLPFRDDINHFKNTNNGNTVTLKVAAQIDHINYILPDTNGTFVSNGSLNCGKYIITDKSTSTIMTAETYQDVDWNIGWHNGGIWVPGKGTYRTTNYK